MKKVIFLDRDGVINQYPGDYKYVTSLEEFRILPGVKEALQKLSEAGFELFIVSNQAGVAKGLYSHLTLEDMDKKLQEVLGKNIVFSGVFYCTHLPEDNCSCRKPRIGSIEKALGIVKKKYGQWDKKNSFFIGDSILDIETGRAAGLKTILVFSGREKLENQNNWKIKPDLLARDLLEAVNNHILKK